MLSFTVDLADCLQLNVLDIISTFVSSLFYLHCGGPKKITADCILCVFWPDLIFFSSF